MFLFANKIQKYDTILYQKKLSKKCALIAVDEIINCDYFFDVYNKDAQKFTSYWYEVQKEIQKL